MILKKLHEYLEKKSWFITIECLEFKIKYFKYLVLNCWTYLKCKNGKRKEKTLAMLMYDLLVGL
jgi:hypothetical protein